MADPKYRHDYLYQRSGSRNWYVKLLSPDGHVEKSLGTPDRSHAAVLAGPMIAEHKAKLFAAKPTLQGRGWIHDLTPGQEHTTPDGGRVLALDRELIYLNHNGAVLDTKPNGGFGFVLR